MEKDLQFAGFIALSCPLKSDSKASIKEIQQSSHYVSLLYFLPPSSADRAADGVTDRAADGATDGVADRVALRNFSYSLCVI